MRSGSQVEGERLVSAGDSLRLKRARALRGSLGVPGAELLLPL